VHEVLTGHVMQFATVQDEGAHESLSALKINPAKHVLHVLPVHATQLGYLFEHISQIISPGVIK
jgi:hypothetical protein